MTILGATAKCPKCGCHDFAIPREAYLDADITCLECGYICTVKQALDAGRIESGTESTPALARKGDSVQGFYTETPSREARPRSS